MHAPIDIEPTKLQTLLVLLRSSAETHTLSKKHPVMLNLPTDLFTMVDTLSQYSGQTRNKVLCELVEVALAAVLNELTEEDKKSIASLKEEIHQSLLGID